MIEVVFQSDPEIIGETKREGVFGTTGVNVTLLRALGP